MTLADPLAPPPLPPVRRLTRAVWIAAALLVCGTVFLIVYLAAPRQPPPATPTAAPVLAPSDPSFLQHPAAEPPVSPEVQAERDALREYLARSSPEAPGGGALAAPPPAATARPESPRETRRESYLRALSAPLLRSNPVPATEHEASNWNRLLAALPPLPTAAGPPSPPNSLSPAPPAAGPRGGSVPLDTAAPTAGVPASAALPRDPRREASQASRFMSTGTVAAGTVIPALLLTAVNSDLPGQLLAQVSRNVYDPRQQTVVIPQASRLLGRYEDQVALAQSRLLVAWNRLILPSGEAIVLGGLTGADPSGAAGLPAATDRHLLRVVGDALLLSVLSAGAQLSQPQSTTFAAAPSAGNVAAGALGQELNAAGLQLLARESGVSPTLRLPAGTPLLVFVQNDLRLDGARVEPADGRR